ncbi:hypothetical protein I302_100972 [Kwoniella bestiolae CBS 10118]|uniref:Conserved oligomeric Golgi complex subunit 7 n=1 Tax=Kwoniella bestiolae CBS 10118 TaxID=1296100 RepID=A0A1B9G6P6_9TREE|nr:hypothetical protein I302_04349 [Kwoniella bestiolae CBS 10118]OCF26662.1 hypothetical protein I302_04349 [Kwoniella bestiolae CBS 10118]
MSSSDPPIPISTPEPPSALSSLATTLDASGSDIPSFLNTLLSSHLPPPLPPPNPAQPPDLAPIDKSLNELLTQLSLLSQDTNSAVEQSIHDVSRTVPRLAYDLQFMRESANGLSSSLGMVQDRFARQIDLSSGSGTGTGIIANTKGSGGGGVGEVNKTNKSLEKLTHLDKLKTRLESARDILREAESWSTLESELIGFIQNQNWLKAGNRLQEASRSMIVFQNTPAEYEDRKRLLVSLQNELENNLSKALRESLMKDEIEQVEIFHQVFKSIDRDEEFRNYYFGSKSTNLLTQWKEVRLVETLASEPPTPIIGDGMTQEGSIRFSVFLPKFYASLLSILHTEVDQIPLIFPPHSAASILATFVQTTFDALDPSLSARLSAISEYHGSEALPELIKCYKATEELGVAIQGLIDRMTFNTQGGMLSGDQSGLASSPSNTMSERISPGIPPTGPSPSHSSMTLSSSKRMSISRRFSRAPAISGPQPVDNSWENTLYEPFLDLQSTYATLERRYLEYIIRNDPALSSSSDVQPSRGKDVAKSLVDRVNVLFGKAEESIARCNGFTHGYGSLGLLTALEAGISTFLADQQKLLIEQLRSGSEKQKSKSNKDELDLEFDGLDSYSTEDWSSFQLGLHILESCKDISGRLQQSEGILENHLVGVGKVLKATSGEGYDVRSTTFGAITLLQQSTLNSIDLHTLINSNPIPKPILPISSNSLNDLIKSSQINLQSIILSPLLSQLETYPHLQVWTKPDKPSKKGELHVPTFSLSPTDVISRVSEGLLDLLRVFEVYSKEVGLGFSLDTLPFVEYTVYHGIQIESENKDDKGSIPSEIILSTWISSLSLSLLSHLTSSTLPSIRGLTSGGVAQLKTDLNYLSNAVGALDVVWDDLGKWERAVGLDELGWRKEMRELRGTEGLGEEGEREREVVRSVGRMRGWV